MSIVFHHSIAEIIQQLLVTHSLISLGGTTPSAAWPSYSYQEISAPDEAVFIIKTTGIPQARIQFGGEAIRKHGLSIIVRSARPLPGEEKANAIDHELMEAVYDEEITLDDQDGSPHRYLVHSIGGGDVIPLGKEQTTRRLLWSANYLVVAHAIS